jgi:CHASE2 domain-containing sensor protein
LNDHKQRKALLRREWLLTVAVALALLGALVFGDIAKPMGNVLYDHLMRLHGFKSTQDIVIVSVDNRALSVELHPNLTRDLHRILTHPI